ncbi:Cathepsin L-like proteinase [Eumeta japonica]|uniref:Cathepsin L-like proteinase n=1 Tax=Eumeta variegata TaxID=151549 RepID=A0A4C1US02_EUMVA|nr:Cathepsin L-like proteinase [Eumeta japonica]
MAELGSDVTKYVLKLLKLIETPHLHDPAEDRLKTAYRNSLHYKIPDRWDWREKGYLPRREEQWRCGACYAFAVAHVVQAQLFKTHGYNYDLSLRHTHTHTCMHARTHESTHARTHARTPTHARSHSALTSTHKRAHTYARTRVARACVLPPQQIVDCSMPDGNLGCGGGSLRASLRYAAREGLERELDYPYFGLQGLCLHSRFRSRARPARWAILPRDENSLQRALATIGLEVRERWLASDFFLGSRHGIYDDPLCTPLKMNHAMLLVGYTPQYWIILNWWGPHWGEEGYMRLRRGVNRCGVANMAAYVELQ